MEKRPKQEQSIDCGCAGANTGGVGDFELYFRSLSDNVRASFRNEAYFMSEWISANPDDVVQRGFLSPLEGEERSDSLDSAPLDTSSPGDRSAIPLNKQEVISK